MKVFRSLADIDPGFGPSVVTIGKFDGVHCGHRAVIAEVLRVARDSRLQSAVVTFDRHPAATIAPEHAPETLVSLDQKLELLAETGLDAALVVTFDRAFADLPAERFVRDYLADGLRARIVMVGSDFRFGHRGQGDVSLLGELGRDLGFMVRLIDDVRAPSGVRVSSTRIRELLAAGDIPGATAMLGHPPTLRGTVVRGAQRGRELGFPTANLSPDAEGLIPRDGVYAGWLIDGGIRRPAAISVGDNPTFEGVPQRQVEAHVIGATLDLYDHTVELAFVERIRGNDAFDGIPALVAKIAEDVATAEHILTAQADATDA